MCFHGLSPFSPSVCVYVCDLMQGKIPLSCLPLRPFLLLRRWALSSLSAFLLSEQLPHCLRATAGERELTELRWVDRWRAAEGKVLLRSQNLLIACGLLGRPYRGNVNLLWSKPDECRWIKKFKRWKIFPSSLMMGIPPWEAEKQAGPGLAAPGVGYGVKYVVTQYKFHTKL